MEYFDYRSFIKEKVLSVCPELKEHKDGFNRDNIDAITSESGFHILPSEINTEFISSQCDDYEDELSLSLQLIFCGGRYVSEKMDYAIGKASCIRNALTLRYNSPEETLSSSLVNRFTIEPLGSNDNTILIDIELTLILKYCTDSCIE